MSVDRAALEELITCVICQDEVENPHMLPCLHTFCHKCLDTHIETNLKRCGGRGRGRTKEGFKCPMCNKFTVLPRFKNGKTGADLFSKDFKTATVQEALKGSPASSGRNIDVADCTPRTESASQPPRLRSACKLSGTFVQTIDLGTSGPQKMFDLEVLDQSQLKLLVCLDFDGSSILVYPFGDGFEVNLGWKYDLESKQTPWRICRKSSEVVAVTVSEPNGILVFEIKEGIKRIKKIETSIRYYGICSVDDTRYAVCTGSLVHLISEDGRVLNELPRIITEQVRYPDNSYIAFTTNQRLVTADERGGVVTSLDLQGKIIWKKRIASLGVVCNVEGIFFADYSKEKVYLFSNGGRKLCVVLEKGDNFEKPSGIVIDACQYLYVINNFARITVWKLSSSGIQDTV